jgi:hypothetical protein
MKDTDVVELNASPSNKLLSIEDLNELWLFTAVQYGTKIDKDVLVFPPQAKTFRVKSLAVDKSNYLKRL